MSSSSSLVSPTATAQGASAQYPQALPATGDGAVNADRTSDNHIHHTTTNPTSSSSGDKNSAVAIVAAAGAGDGLTVEALLAENEALRRNLSLLLVEAEESTRKGLETSEDTARRLLALPLALPDCGFDSARTEGGRIPTRRKEDVSDGTDDEDDAGDKRGAITAPSGLLPSASSVLSSAFDPEAQRRLSAAVTAVADGAPTPSDANIPKTTGAPHTSNNNKHNNEDADLNKEKDEEEKVEAELLTTRALLAALKSEVAQLYQRLCDGASLAGETSVGNNSSSRHTTMENAEELSADADPLAAMAVDAATVAMAQELSRVRAVLGCGDGDPSAAARVLRREVEALRRLQRADRSRRRSTAAAREAAEAAALLVAGAAAAAAQGNRASSISASSFGQAHSLPPASADSREKTSSKEVRFGAPANAEGLTFRSAFSDPSQPGAAAAAGEGEGVEEVEEEAEEEDDDEGPVYCATLEELTALSDRVEAAQLNAEALQSELLDVLAALKASEGVCAARERQLQAALKEAAAAAARLASEHQQQQQQQQRQLLLVEKGSETEEGTTEDAALGSAEELQVHEPPSKGDDVEALQSEIVDLVVQLKTVEGERAALAAALEAAHQELQKTQTQEQEETEAQPVAEQIESQEKPHPTDEEKDNASAAAASARDEEEGDESDEEQRELQASVCHDNSHDREDDSAALQSEIVDLVVQLKMSEGERAALAAALEAARVRNAELTQENAALRLTQTQDVERETRGAQKEANYLAESTDETTAAAVSETSGAGAGSREADTETLTAEESAEPRNEGDPATRSSDMAEGATAGDSTLQRRRPSADSGDAHGGEPDSKEGVTDLPASAHDTPPPQEATPPAAAAEEEEKEKEEEALVTTQHVKVFPEDDWALVLSDAGTPALEAAFAADLSTACGVRAAAVSDVSFTLGSLHAAACVAHPASVPAAALDERIAACEFDNMRRLYDGRRRKTTAGDASAVRSPPEELAGGQTEGEEEASKRPPLAPGDDADRSPAASDESGGTSEGGAAAETTDAKPSDSKGSAPAAAAPETVVAPVRATGGQLAAAVRRCREALAGGATQVDAAVVAELLQRTEGISEAVADAQRLFLPPTAAAAAHDDDKSAAASRHPPAPRSGQRPRAHSSPSSLPPRAHSTGDSIASDSASADSVPPSRAGSFRRTRSGLQSQQRLLPKAKPPPPESVVSDPMHLARAELERVTAASPFAVVPPPPALVAAAAAEEQTPGALIGALAAHATQRQVLLAAAAIALRAEAAADAAAEGSGGGAGGGGGGQRRRRGVGIIACDIPNGGAGGEEAAATAPTNSDGSGRPRAASAPAALLAATGAADPSPSRSVPPSPHVSSSSWSSLPPLPPLSPPPTRRQSERLRLQPVDETDAALRLLQLAREIEAALALTDDVAALQGSGEAGSATRDREDSGGGESKSVPRELVSRVRALVELVGALREEAEGLQLEKRQAAARERFLSAQLSELEGLVAPALTPTPTDPEPRAGRNRKLSDSDGGPCNPPSARQPARGEPTLPAAAADTPVWSVLSPRRAQTAAIAGAIEDDPEDSLHSLPGARASVSSVATTVTTVPDLAASGSGSGGSSNGRASAHRAASASASASAVASPLPGNLGSVGLQTINSVFSRGSAGTGRDPLQPSDEADTSSRSSESGEGSAAGTAVSNHSTALSALLLSSFSSAAAAAAPAAPASACAGAAAANTITTTTSVVVPSSLLSQQQGGDQQQQEQQQEEQQRQLTIATAEGARTFAVPPRVAAAVMAAASRRLLRRRLRKMKHMGGGGPPPPALAQPGKAPSAAGANAREEAAKSKRERRRKREGADAAPVDQVSQMIGSALLACQAALGAFPTAAGALLAFEAQQPSRDSDDTGNKSNTEGGGSSRDGSPSRTAATLAYMPDRSMLAPAPDDGGGGAHQGSRETSKNRESRRRHRHDRGPRRGQEQRRRRQKQQVELQPLEAQEMMRAVPALVAAATACAEALEEARAIMTGAGSSSSNSSSSSVSSCSSSSFFSSSSLSSSRDSSVSPSSAFSSSRGSAPLPPPPAPASASAAAGARADAVNVSAATAATTTTAASSSFTTSPSSASASSGPASASASSGRRPSAAGAAAAEHARRTHTPDDDKKLKKERQKLRRRRHRPRHQELRPKEKPAAPEAAARCEMELLQPPGLWGSASNKNPAPPGDEEAEAEAEEGDSVNYNSASLRVIHSSPPSASNRARGAAAAAAPAPASHSTSPSSVSPVSAPSAAPPGGCHDDAGAAPGAALIEVAVTAAGEEEEEELGAGRQTELAGGTLPSHSQSASAGDSRYGAADISGHDDGNQNNNGYDGSGSTANTDANKQQQQQQRNNTNSNNLNNNQSSITSGVFGPLPVTAFAVSWRPSKAASAGASTAELTAAVCAQLDQLVAACVRAVKLMSPDGDGCLRALLKKKAAAAAAAAANKDAERNRRPRRTSVDGEAVGRPHHPDNNDADAGGGTEATTSTTTATATTTTVPSSGDGNHDATAGGAPGPLPSSPPSSPPSPPSAQRQRDRGNSRVSIASSGHSTRARPGEGGGVGSAEEDGKYRPVSLTPADVVQLLLSQAAGVREAMTLSEPLFQRAAEQERERVAEEQRQNHGNNNNSNNNNNDENGNGGSGGPAEDFTRMPIAARTGALVQALTAFQQEAESSRLLQAHTRLQQRFILKALDDANAKYTEKVAALRAANAELREQLQRQAAEAEAATAVLEEALTEERRANNRFIDASEEKFRALSEQQRLLAAQLALAEEERDGALAQLLEREAAEDEARRHSNVLAESAALLALLLLPAAAPASAPSSSTQRRSRRPSRSSAEDATPAAGAATPSAPQDLSAAARRWPLREPAASLPESLETTNALLVDALEAAKQRLWAVTSGGAASAAAAAGYTPPAPPSPFARSSSSAEATAESSAPPAAAPAGSAAAVPQRSTEAQTEDQQQQQQQQMPCAAAAARQGSSTLLSASHSLGTAANTMISTGPAPPSATDTQIGPEMPAAAATAAEEEEEEGRPAQGDGPLEDKQQQPMREQSHAEAAVAKEEVGAPHASPAAVAGLAGTRAALAAAEGRLDSLAAQLYDIAGEQQQQQQQKQPAAEGGGGNGNSEEPRRATPSPPVCASDGVSSAPTEARKDTAAADEDYNKNAAEKEVESEAEANAAAAAALRGLWQTAVARGFVSPLKDVVAAEAAGERGPPPQAVAAALLSQLSADADLRCLLGELAGLCPEEGARGSANYHSNNNINDALHSSANDPLTADGGDASIHSHNNRGTDANSAPAAAEAGDSALRDSHRRPPPPPPPPSIPTTAAVAAAVGGWEGQLRRMREAVRRKLRDDAVAERQHRELARAAAQHLAQLQATAAENAALRRRLAELSGGGGGCGRR